MATSSGVLCGVCDAQQITKSAEYWCPECEEGLCPDCQKHHSLSKATKTHGVIPVDQYEKLPSSISELVHHCEDHGMKYTNYCPHHDTLCCPVCISTTHVKCSGYLSVQEITKTAKTSTLLENMERSLNDVEKNIKKIIQNREHNLTEIKQQKQKFLTGIKEVREKINLHLDILEQDLVQQINDNETKIQSDVASLLYRLSKEQEIVHKLKQNIAALKDFASNFQTFLGSKTYQGEVENTEKYIESLLQDGSLKQLNLKCCFDEIWETLKQITSFGSISIETGPATLVIKREKDKQAQITSTIPQPSPPKSIHGIKLSLLATYDLPKPSQYGYRGCIIHPNGKMIIADNSSSKLAVVNIDGTVDNDIPCAASYIYDVTNINNKTIAVATNAGIHIIDVDSRKTEKVITTSKTCYGITCSKGELLWCEELKGIQNMNISDGNITTLIEQKLPRNSYVTTYGDKIYQTNWGNQTVTCYTIDGRWQWEYERETGMNYPTCITVDNSSNIYVTESESDNLFVLSPDGQEGKQLLDKSDGLCNPVGVFFEKTENNILIVNRRGRAFLYHIT